MRGIENPYPSVQWIGDADTGFVRLLDQTLLPSAAEWLDCRTVDELHEAIRMLRVRGAPAIGVAAAYGIVLGLQQTEALGPALASAVERLASSRPTAVNLFWALDRMRKTAEQLLRETGAGQLRTRLLQAAHAIFDEDRAMCLAIGRHGGPLIRESMGVLTHCNAGALATSDFGTALAPMFVAHDEGRRFCVFANETRPLLQGARLTAWELHRRGIDVILICDSMAAQVMREKRIDLVIVGADRIAANGDAANKIGTYGVAVLARAHGIPFYVAAPSSTVDLSLATGAGIPIEQRDPREITHGFGQATAPEGVKVYNPAFDVTPAELIRGIITEKGIVEPVREDVLRSVLAS